MKIGNQPNGKQLKKPNWKQKKKIELLDKREVRDEEGNIYHH